MRPDILGRDDERRAIDEVLQAASRGLSGTLVLQGDAGMGKTTLAEYAVESAAELRVLRLWGVESEAEFGFSALHRLLLGFPDEMERLPARQRDALGSAFGMIDGPPADRFIVGLAALSLLANVARRQPLLCVVDDAQWLDRESLDALTFIGRRLQADQIALLFVVRRAPTSSGPPFDGLPILPVVGLPEASAVALLESVVERPVRREVARRIVAETDGCPLAVVEFAAGLSAEQLVGGGLGPEPLPLSRRLEDHFLGQVRVLPQETQTFLLIAAADASGDPRLVWRAAELLDLSPAAADTAVAHDLLVVEPRVAFRHPLIRSAVFGGAAAADRREVHRALAAVSDGTASADQRAWHLAASTIGSDEAVAAELEDRARLARNRGRYATEAMFLSRAAELTPNPNRRGERLLAAAHAHLTSGAHDAAATALAEARPSLSSPVLQAQAQRLDAALHSYSLPNEMPALLLETARSLEPLDARLARDTYAEALEAALVAGQLAKGTTPVEIARAALAAPAVPDGEPTMADLMLEGFGTRLAIGYVEAVPMLRRAVEFVATHEFPAVGIARNATLGNNAAAELWDAEGYGATLARLEPIERERGALDSLRITLGGRGHYEMWAGRFSIAEDLHSEATEIATLVGADARVWEMLKAELFAWQGREAETRAAVAGLTGELMQAAGAGVGVNLARVALGILAMGQSQYQEALASVRPLYDDDIPPHGSQALPEIIEAATRTGDGKQAALAFERLQERAEATATPWALSLLARSSALLADDAHAEAHYQEAIARLDGTIIKTDLARAHLVYGEWLRRQKRRKDARDQLQTAHDLFVEMGAAAFAERARIELTATGATARRRSVETALELTAQEQQVARLAATGATNSDIAATLYISTATVDYHLRKVYRKLGITSRRQLRATNPI